MRKTYILFFLFTFSFAIAFAQVEGTWKMSPQAAALGVGPALGDISWWSNSEADVVTRACYFDDKYEFAGDGTFSNVLDGETWLEGWQGADGCGTPVAPHDGSNAATWTYDDVAGTITLNGVGAYLGLPKVYNGGELSDPADAPASIVYPVEFNATEDTMTINIEIANGAYWRFILTTNAGDPPSPSVTFSVNMSYQVTMGNFDPANDFVDVAGTFNNWGDPSGDELTAGTGDVYSVTLDGFAVDDALEFKFRINGDWNTSEFPSGGPNRTYTVVAGTNEISVWYNDEQPPPPEGGVMADFEDETWGILTPHVLGCGEYDDDAIHPVDETFMVVDNPDASGINTSSKVLKFIRRGTDVGGLPWGGFWANCTPSVDATDSKYVHFMVWKPMVSPIKFKLEGGPDGTLEIESIYPQTVTEGWQDMVFDFSTMTGEYPIVALLPDFQDPFETAGDVEMYIDNIVINGDPNPISGIWNNNTEDPISMYPNPFTNSINIELTNDMKSVVISNIMGQKLFELENVEKGTINIEASDLKSGVYIISLTDANNKITSSKMLKN